MNPVLLRHEVKFYSWSENFSEEHTQASSGCTVKPIRVTSAACSLSFLQDVGWDDNSPNYVRFDSPEALFVFVV